MRFDSESMSSSSCMESLLSIDYCKLQKKKTLCSLQFFSNSLGFELRFDFWREYGLFSACVMEVCR